LLKHHFGINWSCAEEGPSYSNAIQRDNKQGVYTAKGIYDMMEQIADLESKYLIERPRAIGESMQMRWPEIPRKFQTTEKEQ
jgi:hypothetical protein